jgi:hypothetical protein
MYLNLIGKLNILYLRNYTYVCPLEKAYKKRVGVLLIPVVRCLEYKEPKKKKPYKTCTQQFNKELDFRKMEVHFQYIVFS